MDSALPTAILPPAVRLDAWRKDCVHEAWLDADYRYGAAGGCSLTIELSDRAISHTSNDADYKVEMAKNYDTYKGKYKGWAAKEDHHRITVPRNWITTVQNRGLAVVGGMLTLWVGPEKKQEDWDAGKDAIRIAPAIWAEQARGYSTHAKDGYIAWYRSPSEDAIHAAHGATRAAALTSIKRKRALNYSIRMSLVALVEQYGHESVSVADAIATGACVSGIVNWCRRCGIDLATVTDSRGHTTIPQPSQQAITIRELYTGYLRYPLTEVERTLRHAASRRASASNNKAQNHLTTVTN